MSLQPRRLRTIRAYILHVIVDAPLCVYLSLARDFSLFKSTPVCSVLYYFQRPSFRQLILIRISSLSTCDWHLIWTNFFLISEPLPRVDHVIPSHLYRLSRCRIEWCTTAQNRSPKPHDHTIFITQFNNLFEQCHGVPEWFSGFGQGKFSPCDWRTCWTIQ